MKFAGDADLRIEKAADDAIAIRVLDRGPGIPNDQLGAVMQPFFRLEQSGDRGTGLAIAHQLTLAIGGELRLRNRAGGGISAEIILTRLPAPTTDL